MTVRATQSIELDPEVRAIVRGELVELAELESTDIREKVIDAWTYALTREGCRSLTDLQGSARPDGWVLKTGSQLDHVRGVTRLSTRYGDELALMYPSLPLKRDVLIAGAMIHDVGKPLEYNLQKRELWSSKTHVSGWPSARHPVHGWHVCLTVGLPEEIAHIAAVHSSEGNFVVRSLEARIVHHCDYALWDALWVSGELKDPPPKLNPKE
ncbi:MULTISPECIES: HD domain-containing protein [Bradyrhizobium]|uniref:HD domain-containing protein n=1 Tax=Bradyrhizobium centrosematis TaxID=1300039 RepID=UPI002169C81C|nr:HD domain-containing protein [Bradyrhizobium centrosematis]MCS3765873.1 23S rRNA maturation-related 3'-5' exoribonuclease YhaM [Bradyrhizobium centrosematis]MCS3778225.1 23S rRNA maturation-related 3'-5' exoribonuclease YhaM [Bradyrhizobium centrosematis]